MMYDPLQVLESAYVTLLTLDGKHWPARYTRQGQDLLCQLRGCIAQLTGQDIETVQIKAEERATKLQFGIP